jgi:hypothetical protein
MFVGYVEPLITAVCKVLLRGYEEADFIEVESPAEKMALSNDLNIKKSI